MSMPARDLARFRFYEILALTQKRNVVKELECRETSARVPELEDVGRNALSQFSPSLAAVGNDP